MKEQIVYKKVSELKLNTKNPRKNDDAVDTVAKSIQEFGFKNPLIIDKNGVVWCGNTRLKASKKLGLKEVPCIVADDLTEEQIRKLALIDNKSSEIAEWDFDLLKDELKELDLSGFDLDWGITEDIEEKEVEEDDFDVDNAIPEEPKAKLGDIYQLGEHRLMCGDSTKEEDVAKLMNVEKVDIAFSSPPYNAGTTATETATGKITKYNGNNDNKSDVEYIDFLDKYIYCAMNVAEYVFMNVQSISNNKIALIDVLSHNKDIYADTIIWDKQNGQPAMAHNVLNSVFEYIHIFSNKANRSIGTIDFRGTIDNILHLPPQRHNKFANIHNATFSVEFASWFISRFAKESVFDSFGGTGTTLIACEQLQRKCYMMELDPRYVDVIIQRWEDFTGKKAVKLN